MATTKSTRSMSRARIDFLGAEMNCELNPAIIDEIVMAIETVAIPYFLAGMITGAGAVYLVAQIWHYRRAR